MSVGGVITQVAVELLAFALGEAASWGKHEYKRRRRDAERRAEHREFLRDFADIEAAIGPEKAGLWARDYWLEYSRRRR